METTNPIAEKINRLAEIKRQVEGLQKEASQLEAFFLEKGGEVLADTKNKTVSYVGELGKVTVTMSENLKLTWPAYLRFIFGDAYSDAVKEDVKHTPSASAKRLLTGIWTRGFTKSTVAEIVEQLPVDDKTRKVLSKKLKGIRFETDRKNLVDIGGLSEADADQFAYFLNEAAIWESFTRLMKVNQDKKEPLTEEEVIKMIDGAVVVEETPKVSFEFLEGA